MLLVTCSGVTIELTNEWTDNTISRVAFATENTNISKSEKIAANTHARHLMYELDSMHNYLNWASMVWLLSLFI